MSNFFFLLIVNMSNLIRTLFHRIGVPKELILRHISEVFFTETPEESKHVIILSFWVEYQIRKFSIHWPNMYIKKRMIE